MGNARGNNENMNKIIDKYQWTSHSLFKMRYYGLSQQRIKRIIRHPGRTEEAIVPGMIAVMQPAGLASPELSAKAGGKRYSEIWAMYKFNKNNFKIITAWRYPGKSPERNPIPKEILDEIKRLV